jgi:predicted ATPase
MISNQYISQVRLRRDDVPSFTHYPFSLSAVRHLDVLDLHPRVTFLIGENGCGKSTLLEAIAVAWGFNPEGGSKNFRFWTRPSRSFVFFSAFTQAGDSSSLGRSDISGYFRTVRIG